MGAQRLALEVVEERHAARERLGGGRRQAGALAQEQLLLLLHEAEEGARLLGLVGQVLLVGAQRLALQARELGQAALDRAERGRSGLG